MDVKKFLWEQLFTYSPSRVYKGNGKYSNLVNFKGGRKKGEGKETRPKKDGKGKMPILYFRDYCKHTEHAEYMNKPLDSAKCKFFSEPKAFHVQAALCSSALKRVRATFLCHEN